MSPSDPIADIIDPKIAEYGGRIVKTSGDGLLLEFPSVVEAVRCAVDVQRRMAERNAEVPIEERLAFRIGINVGDSIIDDEAIYGDGVNVAACLQALAEPGGICVSKVVRDQVLDKLSFTFDELGAQQVKNIARPVDFSSCWRSGPELRLRCSRHIPFPTFRPICSRPKRISTRGCARQGFRTISADQVGQQMHRRRT